MSVTKRNENKLFEKHKKNPHTSGILGEVRPRLLFIPSAMLVVSAFLSILVTRLANAPEFTFGMFSPILMFILMLAIVHTALRLGHYNGDGPLVGAAMTLCGLGIVMQTRIGSLRIDSITSTEPSQFVYPLAVAIMLITYFSFRRGRHAFLEKMWFPCLAASVIVICVVLVLGRRFRGAVFLPGNINPVEIVKPLLIVFLAATLNGHAKLLKRKFLGIPLPPLNIVVSVAILWAIPMALLLLQKDLGLITLLNSVMLIMLYSLTHRSGYLLGGIAAVMLLVRFAIPLSAHAAKRFAIWSDPFSAATGSGWQVLQGMVALYSGGVLGKGIGAGAPTSVPIVESDFIYIIFGEELGYVGCGLLLLLYVAFAIRGLGISARKRSEFSSVLAAGLTSCIIIQAMINIGGVTKAIPLTGITLPFISHGGSSLITMFLMTGLLMALSERDEQ